MTVTQALPRHVRIVIAMRPYPKGSLRPVKRKSGGIYMVEEGGDKFWEFYRRVQDYARQQWNAEPTDRPMWLSCRFCFKAPKKSKNGYNKPVGREPDLDKLVRGVCDAMTGIVYRDDRQICRYREPFEKCYSGEGSCIIEVGEIET